MDMQEPPAFVVYNGQAVATNRETLKTFNLRNGQTVDTSRYYQIIRDNAERGLAEISKRKSAPNP